MLGPLIGVGLTHLFGIEAVYAALAALAAVAMVWTLAALPALPVVPRPRYTLADLVRQTTERGFLVPTALLATTTAVLGVAVGFLPLLATRLDLPALAGAAAVAALALASTLVQPLVGRLRDTGRIADRTGTAAGLALAAVALGLIAVAPHWSTLLGAAVLLGVTVGTVTPLAFAHLAAATPEERMGRTMGNAELGRELGDAGGPSWSAPLQRPQPFRWH
nr:hypothetical protein GCM10025732_43970 [Glycomyces mayteni]